MPRLRLAILGESPCDLCTAACCKQNGHEFAVLLEGDDERRRFAPFAIDVPLRASGDVTPMSFGRVLPYRDGRCAFLGADDRCTIYEDRPLNCRRFQCVSGYHLGGADLTRHSEFLQRNPNVVARLESL
jgi:Fe-S-cluster containining protein